MTHYLRASLAAGAGIAMLAIVGTTGCTTTTSKAASSSSTAASTGATAAKAPPTTVLSSSHNTSHPPAGDVALNGCEVDPTTSWPDATGVIVNHSSKASDYQIQVGFYAGATRVADGDALESNVSPGESVDFKAQGFDTVTGTITCKVISVDREAAAG